MPGFDYEELLKTAKPILFNTEMVRAILERRKTATRRVVKPQPKTQLFSVPIGTCWDGYFCEKDSPVMVRPPYFPGDILYVREAFFKDALRYMYKANYSDSEKFFQNDKEVSIKWRPSIHMPREAARIFLRVKDVWVERLQDIQERGPASAEKEESRGIKLMDEIQYIIEHQLIDLVRHCDVETNEGKKEIQSVAKTYAENMAPIKPSYLGLIDWSVAALGVLVGFILGKIL